MQKIEFTSKLMLALIAVTAISVGIGVQAYNIQAADAQAKLPNNSVRSETIVNGQVKTEDIADKTIQAGDIAAGVIPDGGGVQPTVHEVRDIGLVAAHSTGRADATCPDGEIVTGGGFSSPITNGVALNFFGSASDSANNAWVVVAQNPGDVEGQFNAVAVCMDFSP